jgi:hypothetical protein
MVDVSKAISQAARENPAADIQVMGDSVAYGSIWASVIADSLEDSKTVVNYGIPGSDPIVSYFLLQRQVNSGNAPRTVLYAHAPHTFSENRNIAVIVGAFCNIRETFDLLLTGFNASDLAYGLMTKVSYSLRYRDSIRQLLIGGETDFFTREDRAVLFGEERMLRYLADDPRFAERNANGLPEPPALLYDPFLISPRKREYVDRMMKLASNNNIQIFWVSLPVPRATYAIRSKSEFFNDYYSAVDKLVASSSLEYLRRDVQVLPDQDFRDYWHLQASTGAQFSKDLAGSLDDLYMDDNGKQ